MQNKTFRLFISSTFNDFRREREVLQTKVFPHIKDYASKEGYVLQPIDLRWGVSNEAQLDQKTLELCLNEVRACKTHLHPNFLIMIGDRYGWIPLPYAIEVDEFKTIISYYEDIDKHDHYKIYFAKSKLKALKEWYKLDPNQLPASYTLKERSGEYKEFEKWGAVESTLRTILQQAVKNSSLDEEQKRKYFLSATEAEVEEGILPYIKPTKFQEENLLTENTSLLTVDPQHVFGFFRNIDKSSQIEDKFIQDDYKEAQEFKTRVNDVLPKANVLTVQDIKQVDKETLEEDYLEEFEKRMIKFLESQIDEQKKQETEESLTPLQIELQAQSYFASNKRKDFLAQEKLRETIANYITNDNQQPLVIYGASGRGKSALMSKAIQDTLTKKVLYRFVSATPNSSSSKEILVSIFEELGVDVRSEQEKQKAQQSEEDKPSLNSNEDQESFEDFSYRIHSELLNIKENIVIFIDALDQLGNDDQFLWLPQELPSNVKIVLSALEDEKYPDDSKYLEALKTKTDNLHLIPEFNQPTQLLIALLKREERTIDDNQLSYFLEQFKKVKSPLYVNIAFQEIKNWKSEDTTQTLADTQKGIIQEFITNLSKEYHHNKKFVDKVLGYIYASRDGLSESELLQLLAQDEEFIKEMAPETWHENPNKELPLVHWTRLHTQLKPFLSLKTQDSEELMYFFHREFEDVIKQETNQREEHKAIIKATQTLILENQDKEFDVNRWGKLYWILVGESQESNLKEYSEFLLKVSNGSYIVKSFDYLKTLTDYYELNNFYDKYTILVKIQYFIIKYSYSTTKGNTSMLVDVLIQLGKAHAKQFLHRSAIKYYEEALEYLSSEDINSLEVMSLKFQMFFAYLQSNDEDKTREIIDAISYESAMQFYSSLNGTDMRLVEIFFGSHLQLALININEKKFQNASKILDELLPLVKQAYDTYGASWNKHYLEFLHLGANLNIEISNLKEGSEYLELAEKLINQLYENNPRIWLSLYVENRYFKAKIALKEESLLASRKILENIIFLSTKEFQLYPNVWSSLHIDNLELLSFVLEQSGLLEEAIKKSTEINDIVTFNYHKDSIFWNKYRIKSLENLSYLYLKLHDIVNFLDMLQVLKDDFEDKYDEVTFKIIDKYKLNSEIQINNLFGSIIENHEDSLNSKQLALFYLLYAKIQQKDGDLEFADMLYQLAFDNYLRLFGMGHKLTIESKKNLDSLGKNIRLELQDNGEEDVLLYQEMNQYRARGEHHKALDTLHQLIKLLKTLPNKGEVLLNMEKSVADLTLDVATMYKKQNNKVLAIEYYRKALEAFENDYLADMEGTSRQYIMCLDNYASADGSKDVMLVCDKKAYEISRMMFEKFPNEWDEDFLISTKNYFRTLKKYKLYGNLHSLMRESMQVYFTHIKNDIHGLIKNYTILHLELFQKIKYMQDDLEVITQEISIKIESLWQLYKEKEYDEYNAFFTNIYMYSDELAKGFREEELFHLSKFCFSIAMNSALKLYLASYLGKNEILATIHNYTGSLREKSVQLHKKKNYQASYELELEILEIHLTEYSQINVTIENIQEDLKVLNLLNSLSKSDSEIFNEKIKILFEKYNLKLGYESSNLSELVKDSKLAYIIDDEND